MKNVSVLLPFHRHDSYLYQAIDSVLNSNGVKVELVLIDDRPLELQSEKISIKDTRISQISTSGGVGYGRALEIGSARMSSDIVALMNSDDIMHPNRFQVQMNSLKESEVCFSDIIKINEKGLPTPSILGVVPSSLFHPVFLLLGSYSANATWAMHRDWWDKWAFFDNGSALDWRIAMNAFPHSEISYAPEVPYLYRQHRLQVTKKGDSFSKFEDVYSKWSQLLDSILGRSASQSIFFSIAAPYSENVLSDLEEMLEWKRDIPFEIPNFTESQISVFIELINRRILLSGRSKKALRSRNIPVLLSAFSALPSLFHDLKDSIKIR